MVQMRDLREDGSINIDGAVCTTEPRHQKHHLRKDDIIFRSRGLTLTPVLVPAGLEHAILAAPLLLIRPKPQRVVPEYLFWWLSHPARRYIRREIAGSSLPMISARAVARLPVTIPSKPRQQAIGGLFLCALREQHLSEKLVACRMKQWEAILNQKAGLPLSSVDEASLVHRESQQDADPGTASDAGTSDCSSPADARPTDPARRFP